MLGDILITKVSERGYYAVDLDDTLAKYKGPKGNTEIGDPNIDVLGTIHYLHNLGFEIRLFTARCGFPDQIELIEAWLKKYNLDFMIVTNVKSHGAIAIIDDKAVPVKDGKIIGEIPMEFN